MAMRIANHRAIRREAIGQRVYGYTYISVLGQAALLLRPEIRL